MVRRILIVCLALLAWQAQAAVPLGILIPKPFRTVPQAGTFVLDGTVMMLGKHNSEPEINQMDRLSRELYKEAGITLARRGKAKTIAVNLDFDLPDSLGAEGYLLTISPEGVEIRSNTEAGLSYGITSLVQMASLAPMKGKAELECGQIIDKPRFSWRGAHLDVARHFFSVDQVKTYLDWMALYKFNTFHWHLSDDQGWRIEIKKYPLLTKIGSTRAQTVEGSAKKQPVTYDGRAYGGYYTQEDIKEVVRYAQTRFITVVPEIDMPGHMQAAIAAYPKLGCTKDSVKVWQTWGVSKDILNPLQETQTFMKDVLDELSALFPAEFIHLGGDEVPKGQWKANPDIQKYKTEVGAKNEEELQGYFMTQMEGHLTELGKRMVGWDENLTANVKPTCVIMAWRGVDRGLEALKKGHQVVMSPTKYSYFDTYQAEPAKVQQPLAIGGMVPLKQVLEFNPIPEAATDDERKRVIGVQCNLWSEYIPDMPKLQYQAFPRWLAMAEVGWSLEEKKAYQDFKPRAIANMKRLKEKYGIKPGPVQE